MPQHRVDLTGHRFGRWTVLHEGASYRAAGGQMKTRWACLCDCGTRRDVPTAGLRRGTSKSCGCLSREVAAAQMVGRTGERHNSWAGEGVTYSGFHQRLRRIRGAASSHPCADCGEMADHWTYLHGCADERQDSTGTFCTHLEHFEPRCVPCHSIYDGETRIGGSAFAARRKEVELAQGVGHSAAL